MVLQMHKYLKQSCFLISSFWLCCWMILLAVTWLMPNHYAPWFAFHADAWIAMVLLLLFGLLIFRADGKLIWHSAVLLPIFLIGVIWGQYEFDMIPQFGIASVGCIYIFGFFLAMLMGSRWEIGSSKQILDVLFVAIGIASVFSVGLQLKQWLELDGMELWILRSDVKRPSANLGQPNQLGTLLIWGILSALWGLVREKINGWVALLAIVFFLFGIALTGSRTAWIGIVLLVFSAWWWRNLWHIKNKMPRAAIWLFFYFIVAIIFIDWWNYFYDIDVSYSKLDGVSGEYRLRIWRSLINAAVQKPWLGYGWGQVASAQMAVADQYFYSGGVYSYSHNLLLDLVLWFGIPFGLLVFMVLLVWMYKNFRAVNAPEDAVLIMFLMVIFNHAMLELPLYYGYFLLPVGLVVGALNVRLSAPILWVSNRWVLISLWMGAASLLSLVVRDYLQVEQSFRLLRMEWQNFKISRPRLPPDVLLLTQWRDYIRMARLDPMGKLSAADLDSMRAGIVVYPNFVIFNKLAISLALNHQPDEARLWLIRLCKVSPAQDCEAAKSIWAAQSSRHSEIAAIPWPVQKGD